VIGEMVSHYRVAEKLGGGGMGVVYRAEDTRLRRTVALKFLPPGMTRDDRSKKRFIREAQAASALDHPNICTIHEIDQTPDGQLFICMGYYEGETLKKRSDRGPMSVSEAIQTVSGVAKGLAEAHANGIVHRDIKPANIMLTNHDEVKIVDFGLAKLVGGSHVTGGGMAPGTLFYMSPEQVKGDDVDARADIFSLGVVLYELITGSLPFSGDHEAAVMYEILNQDPEPISTCRKDVPKGLQRVIDRSLNKKAEDRYQTVTQMRDDLERIRGGELPARSSSLRRRPARRRRLAIPVIAVILALIAATIIPPVRQTLRQWLAIAFAPDDLHMAVLPLENVGGDPVQQAFCDGMMETLTSKLTQLGKFHNTLWVVPASEVRQRGVESPGEAGRAFGVNLVVTGSVQQLGDGIRLTMNLVAVGEEAPRQLRSSVIDVRMVDVALLQDRTVAKTAEMLSVELAPQTKRALAAGGTDDSEAFRFYVLGRGYLQRYEQADNIDTAIHNFVKALLHDEDYALAYAALGEAYWRKYNKTLDTQWIEHAVTNCRRAAELNDLLGPVHTTLGMINRGTGEYEEAILEFDRALALEPTSAAAYRGLAGAYADLRRIEEAEATFRKAIDMKPDYWAGHHDLGNFYLRHGRYEDAAGAFAEVVRCTPDNIWGYNNLGAAYWYLERWPDAREMFRRSIEVEPNRSACSNLGIIEYINGDYAEAAKRFKQALELDEARYTTWANLGNAYYWMPEQRDEAYASYRRAAELAEAQREVNPRNAELLASLASYYAILEEDAKALILLEQAQAIAGDEIDVVYFSGHTYEQLGDRSKALKWIIPWPKSSGILF
jgi:serine/threonine-protein kinase